MFESHLQQPLMLSLSEEANWGEFKLESFLCVVGCVALSLQPPWLSSPNHFCLHRCCSYKIKWHGAHARFPLCCCNFHHNEPVKSYCIKLGSNGEEEGVIWIPVGHQPLVLIFFSLCYCVSFSSFRDALRLLVRLYIPLCHFPTGLIKGLKQCSVNRAALQSKHQFLLLCCQALKWDELSGRCKLESRIWWIRHCPLITAFSFPLKICFICP